MGFLADALSAQGNVAHINLSANRVGPEGGVALGKALGNNNALTHLDLFGNELEVCENICLVKWNMVVLA